MGIGRSDFKVIDVTPTLDTSEYASGDVLFDKVEIPNAVLGNGGCSKLIGLTISSKRSADTDIIVLHLDEGQSGYQDFTIFGGLPSTSTYGTSGTGDIKFTTTGAGAAGDAYQIVIRASKDY